MTLPGMTFSEMRAIIDECARPLKAESIPLVAAYNRVSARSLSSTRDMPPFDVSALDGYGVKGAGPRFEIKAELSPFAPLPAAIKQGEAFFVPTGGRIPDGARFVMREHVTEDGRFIRVETGEDERRVVRKGDWLPRGKRVVDKGGLFTPETMALAAMAGLQAVQVFRRPAVAVVSTGSELKSGLMVDSNAFMLAGLIQRDGGEVLGLYRADDAADEISALAGSLRGANLLILTGGTAQGKKDLTRQALVAAGGHILLDGPPITPGKTMTFGRKGSMAFFILPGNPGAIRTLYDVFVARALRAMAGGPTAEKGYTLALPEDVRKPGEMARLVPVLLEHRRARIESMYPEEPNGYAVIEQGPEHVAAGSMVTVIEP